MYKLRYLPQARNDLTKTYNYIKHASGSPETALEYTEKLKTKCRDLAALSANIGHPRPELRAGLRSFPHGNYIIFLTYENDFLTIVRIIEGSKDMPKEFLAPL